MSRILQLKRGLKRHLPTLQNGEPAWVTDEKQLYIGTEKGNVLIGAQGPKGERGERGPQGPAGAVGPAGAKGDKGDTGATGATGARGPQGLQGPKGEQGLRGATGAKGDKGDTGPQGATGPAGPNAVSATTTVSGFTNGQILFNNNGRVGAKAVTAASVGAFATDEIIPITNGGTGAKTVIDARVALHLFAHTVVVTTGGDGSFRIGEIPNMRGKNVSAVVTPQGDGPFWVKVNYTQGYVTGVLYQTDGKPYASKQVRLSIIAGSDWTWE